MTHFIDLDVDYILQYNSLKYKNEYNIQLSELNAMSLEWAVSRGGYSMLEDFIRLCKEMTYVKEIL